MSKVQQMTQLKLEAFADLLKDAEDSGEGLIALSAKEVRQRSMAARAVLEGGEEQFEWAEKYHDLINAHIPWRIAAFIAWSSVPRDRRLPRTQEELAQQVLGLTSDRTIATWRKKYPEIDTMIADMQAEEMLKFRAGAFHALGTSASAPDYKHASDRRLFFEMTGDYVPRQKFETAQGAGVGKRLLDMLDKIPTDKLVEMLGAEALEMLAELEDELEEEGQGDDEGPATQGTNDEPD